MPVGQLRLLLCVKALLLVLALAVAPLDVASAPIVGEDEDIEALIDALAPEGFDGPESTAPADKPAVLEISIIPSTDEGEDPQTVIIVRQDAGKKICVNHSKQGIIVRAFIEKDEDFAPEFPTEIQGSETRHKGELVGYNEDNVFIKPNTPEDLFSHPDECFTAGGVEACFLPEDLACDQQLLAGDFVCVSDVINVKDCSLSAHNDLLRQLRIMVALNSVPGLSPAAGPEGGDAAAQPVGGPSSTGGMPSGSAGAAPSFSDSFSGSGGQGQCSVPNVIGLALAAATSAITANGLTVGTVTIVGDSQQGSDTFIVIDQVPSAGPEGEPCPPVNLTVEPSTPIPEPSTLGLFIVGLLLAFAAYRLGKRRTL